MPNVYYLINLNLHAVLTPVLGCIGQVYLQTRRSEGAIVAYVRFLGGPELCSIPVGDLVFGPVILDCSFERRTEDAHSTNCHGGPGRQTAVANSIKDNMQQPPNVPSSHAEVTCTGTHSAVFQY